MTDSPASKRFQIQGSIAKHLHSTLGCRLWSMCVPKGRAAAKVAEFKQIHASLLAASCQSFAEPPKHLCASRDHWGLTGISAACMKVLLCKQVGYLKVVSEELVVQLGDLELVGLLPVHNPGAALALRVNQHRISGGSCHHNTVLNTQVISGQPLQAQRHVVNAGAIFVI